MNKAEVIDKIVAQTDLSKADVEKVISCFFETVKSTLKGKQHVRLVGFGTFFGKRKKGKNGAKSSDGAANSNPLLLLP